MGAPLDLICVIGSLNVGGTEKHLLRLLPELRRRGWRTEIFCVSGRGELAARFEAEGITINCPIAVSSERKNPLRRIAKVIKSSACLILLLRQRRPTIIHCFLPEAYLVGSFAALLTGIPVRIMSRRSLSTYQKRRFLVGRIERLLHRRMHALLGNSQAVVAELRTECPGHPLIELIYNGVDFPDSNEPGQAVIRRASFSIPADATVIGIVANLIPYKGHDDLLMACSMLRAEDSGWFLLIIGRDEGIGKRLVSLAQELGIGQRVVFIGESQEIMQFLRWVDIGVSSSHEEGFSNAILEYMFAGIPVVATDVGGNAEAVLSGVTGIVVPPRDPAAMAQAMQSLIDDPSLRRKFGTQGRERARSTFSLEKCADLYERIYLQLLSNYFFDMPRRRIGERLEVSEALLPKLVEAQRRKGDSDERPSDSLKS